MKEMSVSMILRSPLGITSDSALYTSNAFLIESDSISGFALALRSFVISIIIYDRLYDESILIGLNLFLYSFFACTPDLFLESETIISASSGKKPWIESCRIRP